MLPRLNQRLIAPASNVLPLFDINPCRAKVPSEFEQLLPSEQRTQCILEQIKYVTKGEAYEETKWFNVWLVADLNSPSGREFLENGMKALKKSDQLRLGFMHNGQKKIKTNTPSFSQLINALVEKLANTLAKQALNKALSMDEQGITDLLQTLALEKLITGQVCSFLICSLILFTIILLSLNDLRYYDMALIQLSGMKFNGMKIQYKKYI